MCVNAINSGASRPDRRQEAREKPGELVLTIWCSHNVFGWVCLDDVESWRGSNVMVVNSRGHDAAKPPSYSSQPTPQEMVSSCQ